MTLLEVGNNKRLIQEFIELPVRIYADEPNWIRPFDHDIEAIFDKKKNKKFEKGSCIRWVLEDTNGQIIGRVAAFIDPDTAYKSEQGQPTGGMGFFECIDNKEAAFVLMNACKEWLQKQGIEAMDGPINFGDRQQFWGLMIKGWDLEPTYQMPWTKQYYIEFFEEFGFQNYFNQYVFLTPIAKANVTAATEEKARRIWDSGDFDFRHLEIKQIKKYAEDFRIIYNAGWANFSGFKPMTEAQSLKLVESMKPILDEQLLWFAYDHDDKPSAFFIIIPDLNQIVKHLNGKLGWYEKIKFLLLKWRGAMTRSVGIVFGVVPQHQGKGLESAIALYFKRIAQTTPDYQYETMELNWIGDFNPKMVRFCQSSIGAHVVKEYVTYRYLFDRTKPFTRCAKVG